MPNNYTFYPRFEEYVTLYRGVVRVWIGDGSIPTQQAGYLYAEYIDGLIQELGFVSDYPEAKTILEDLGEDLTYAEWVALLVNVPTNAIAAQTAATTADTHEKQAEAWAVGQKNGTDVPSTDTTYHNNSKYYAELAGACADSVRGATIAVSYQNSTDGTTVPVGEWSQNPLPEKGKYLWTKTVMTWTDQSSSTVYAVGYEGVDGSGAVHSVNNLVGNVTLYGDNIRLSYNDNRTITQMLQIATNSEVDALFAAG